MKKQLLLALALMMGFLPVKAQDEKKEEGFQFTTIKEIPITAVRDQHLLPGKREHLGHVCLH